MADNLLLSFRLTQNGHIRIFREKDAQVWDRNAGAWGSVTTVTAPNAAVGVTYTAEHKVGVVALPANFGSGTYKILLYNTTQVAADAADEAVHIFVVQLDDYNNMRVLADDRVMEIGRPR